MLTDLNAIPDMTDGDVERLLAALTRETRRVERVELSFGAVWIKRYGTERPPIWTKAQTALARLFGQPFLRPSPYLDSKGMIELYQSWCSQFPIFSIEDGMAEDDWKGWQALTAAIGGKTQLVGDDLFVTNTERLQRGINE